MPLITGYDVWFESCWEALNISIISKGDSHKGKCSKFAKLGSVWFNSLSPAWVLHLIIKVDICLIGRVPVCRAVVIGVQFPLVLIEEKT